MDIYLADFKDTDDRTAGETGFCNATCRLRGCPGCMTEMLLQSHGK